MKRPSIGFALEGVPFAVMCIVATVTLAILECVTGTAIMLAATLFVIHFFRDPERVIPRRPGAAVSPADGTVCRVGLAKDPFTGKQRKVVCVFMSLFNVHVNRAPVEGTVDGLKYFPGKFFNASLSKASEDNERLALSMTTAEGGQWTVVQIAGLIARRIITWAEEGDELTRGQRFGLIKFGSRVDLYLPDAYDVTVKVGDKVVAGQSVLAKRK